MEDSNRWLETITEKEKLEYENHKLEGIVEELNRKLGLAKEVLKFYAKEQIYQVYSEGIPTEVEQDSGSYARETLEVLL